MATTCRSTSTAGTLGQRRNEIQDAEEVRIDDLAVKRQIERLIIVEPVDPGVQDEDVRQLTRRRQAADEVLDVLRRTDIHAFEPDGRIATFELRDPPAVHGDHLHLALDVMFEKPSPEPRGRARDQNALDPS